eukprot:TRINITY_DN5763_c0_g1_i1.p1 TRINITY_DN5763_c0_g1~~TRINITY_DN5763_c0_g1_i1.p1  ORF type:complete len:199 (-),score=56.50 TRINITY_DN5763_c0_g1_i1:48-644(-)
MADNEESVSDFTIANNAAKKVEDIMNLDKDDEALRKWKEKLLGNVAEVYSPPDDPRRVVITDLVIQCEGRPEIKYHFDSKEELEKLKEKPFVLKESCKYRITVTFRVQHELVTGLRHVNTIYRKGIRVDKDTTMIGSYAPQKEPYEVTIPRSGWEEAPSGIFARGTYQAVSKFEDDDRLHYLQYEYTFAIKKDWTGDE